MTVRSTTVGARRADARPDIAAHQGAGVHEPRRPPGHVGVGDEDDQRHGIDDQRKDAAQAVDPGQGFGGSEAEDGQEDHTQAGTEVRTVDRGDEAPAVQEGPMRATAALGDAKPGGEPGLSPEQQAGKEQQVGGQRTEVAAGRGEQQDATEDGPGDDGADQAAELVALLGHLPAEPGHPTEVAGPDAHGGSDIGGEGGVTDGQEGGEGDERAAPGPRR